MGNYLLVACIAFAIGYYYGRWETNRYNEDKWEH